jgi:hypothetical protein
MRYAMAVFIVACIASGGTVNLAVGLDTVLGSMDRTP